MNAYFESPKKGLQTEIKGKSFLEWGKIFLDLSKESLLNRNFKNKNNNDNNCNNCNNCSNCNIYIYIFRQNGW